MENKQQEGAKRGNEITLSPLKKGAAFLKL
jgi:hypothetical protein